jgi:hypothetical protein
MGQEQVSESGITEYFEGYQQLELEGVRENLTKVRNAIFVVAAVSALGGIILYSSNKIGREDLILNFVLFAAYLVLAFLTRKFPMMCIVIALILFVGTWILNIVVGGTSQIF